MLSPIPSYRCLRAKARSLRWAAALLLTFLSVGVAHAQGTTGIQGVAWETYTDTFRCVITSDKPIRINDQDLVEERGLFYLDLYNVHVRIERPVEEFNNLYLRAVRFKGYEAERVLRLIFWPQPGVSYRVRAATSPNRVIVELRRDSYAPPPSGVASAPTATPSPTPTPTPAPTPTPDSRATLADSVLTGYQSAPPLEMPGRRSSSPAPVSTGRKKVVIDAGHGGYNLGAIGAVRLAKGRVQEKEITLQISLLLAGLIQKAGNMDYHMTRTSDEHVSLFRRVRMAEQIAEPGDGQSVFVSIHCNWWRTPTPRGVEFYFLDETAKEATAALRELENDEAYKDDLRENTTLSKIFFSMEHDKLHARQAQSAQLCAYLDASFRQMPYFAKYNRGVKKDNFTVLKNFLMPAILVEAGFISNPEECRMLLDANHQYNVAALIFNGINYYFKAQDPSFQAMEFKLR